ncbi:MAG: hypothetical protein V5A74_05695 [Desulfohalobiaceae bacterium]
MGWKKDRLAQGWKQQLVWLWPESVTKLERLKKSSGKSYQSIINEMIQNYDLPLEDEESRLERNILRKMEAYIEAKFGGANGEGEKQAHEDKAAEEEKAEVEDEFRIEIPEDLQESDKQDILKTIRELHEKEGRSFRSIVDYLKQKGVKASKK